MRRRTATILPRYSGRKHKVASSLPYIATDEVERMAYRNFIDSEGIEWQAWDVLPKAVDRRFTRRRVSREGFTLPERRRADRRKVEGRWTPLTSGLRDGWLCFDADGNRRRLTPIPPDWEDCPPSRLEGYCRSASAVRLPSARGA
jgi:hypothetical protein